MKYRKEIFSSTDEEKVFTKIYDLNWWGSDESISGHGSTLVYTENLRRQLPVIFKKYLIHSVFDAPCGDFNWMSKVVSANDLNYIGADIVEQLIESNKVSFSNEKVKFIQSNIITDKFPNVDLWICRDCFIHFSYKDIYRALSNYIDSGIPYVLTTTHINLSGFKNIDIKTGDGRVIDLFSEPFFFPEERKYRIEDWVKPHPPREMVMFSREQVVQALIKMKLALGL